MMSVYKYSIWMEYNSSDGNDDPETNKIESKNIDSLLIDCDFNSEAIQPIVVINVSIDSNLLDKMITNQETDTIKLIVKKHRADLEMSVDEPFIGSIFNYKILEDVNKTKDKDYQGDEANKEDKLRTVSIGLFSKKLTDLNVRTINFTVQNTRMIDVVCKALEGIPVVIEPFKYNKAVDQLVIPPQESVNKAIKFLYNIAVFYDTPYRFFMDFNASYLVSSGAIATPMAGELSSSVNIDIREVTEEDALVLGMEYEDGHYTIPVPQNQTTYTTNTTMNQEFNELIGIVDPSRENSLPSIVNEITEQANNIVSKVKEIATTAVKPITDNINQIQKSFNDMKYQWQKEKEQLETFNSEHNEILSLIKSRIDAHANEMDDVNVEWYYKQLELLINYNGNVNTGVTGMGTPVGTMDIFRSNSGNTGYGVTSITSLVNGIHTENLTSNLDSMVSQLGTNESKIGKMVEQSANIIRQTTEEANRILNNTLAHKEEVESISDFTYIKGGHKVNGVVIPPVDPSGGGSADTDCYVTVDMSDVREKAKDIDAILKEFKAKVEAQLDDVAMTEITCSNLKKTNTSVIGQVKKLQSFRSTLDEQFKDISNTWKEATNNIKTAIKKMESLSSLGISSIEDLKDISKITDLSAVGRLGVSMITTKLDIPGVNTIGDRATFINLVNDDPNKIKAIQSSLEIGCETFTMEKEGLDNSIFTINKEYTVSNNKERKDKDGRYILTRRREVYQRQGEEFVSNTLLNFTRVSDKLHQAAIDKSSANNVGTTTESSGNRAADFLSKYGNIVKMH